MCLATIDHTWPRWNFHRLFLTRNEKKRLQWIPVASSDPVDARRWMPSFQESRNWNDFNCSINGIISQVDRTERTLPVSRLTRQWPEDFIGNLDLSELLFGGEHR